MYKISKEVRDEIVNYLANVVVSASVGASLFQIAQTLAKLEEIKPEPKVEETK